MAGATGVDPRLLDRLAEVVGRPHLILDPDVVASYAPTGPVGSPATPRPWCGPGSTDEVRRRGGGSAASTGSALVPQGGNTGLVGGGCPAARRGGAQPAAAGRPGGRRPGAGQVTAGAGVTLADGAGGGRGAGWAYGVDLASRDSATVGGMVATNAGGLHVLRYGDTRAQLVGIEAVLGTGAVVSHLGRPASRTTPATTFPASSAGARAPWPWSPPPASGWCPRPRAGWWPSWPSTPSAPAVGRRPRRCAGALESLAAAELFFDDGLALVCRVDRRSAGPFARPHRAYLLVEAAGAGRPHRPSWPRPSDALEGVADVAVATDSARARPSSGATGRPTPRPSTPSGPPTSSTSPCPPPPWPTSSTGCPSVRGRRSRPGAATWLFGHAADGNIHVNVTGLAPDDERVDDAVLRLVAASMGGSISAEHGIGTAKRRWLALNRSAAELAAFPAIKRALDPAGVLNPNVLLPAP